MHALKNNPYGAKKATVMVTGDVSKKEGEKRKILETQHLPDSVKVAFISYTVPTRIQYKEGQKEILFLTPESKQLIMYSV